MAKLTLSDGTEKYVDYNTAAKVYQVLKGNELLVPKDERPEIMKLALHVESVDFKKMDKK